MKIKRFEQLEWGRFYSPDTHEFLNDIFIDFLHPVNKEDASTSKNIKSGTNMMINYVLEIPFNENKSEELIKILNKVQECVERIQDVIPTVKYNISLNVNKLNVILWN